MLPKVQDVSVEQGFTLRVVFDDGVVTEVDLTDDLWGPMMEPLKDAAFFARVAVDKDSGSIVWPNGLDLDPVVLHGDLPPSPPSAMRVRRIPDRTSRA